MKFNIKLVNMKNYDSTVNDCVHRRTYGYCKQQQYVSMILWRVFASLFPATLHSESQTAGQQSKARMYV
jgi:hypothetical protein